MTIRTDQRQIETRPQPGLDAVVRKAWMPALEHELLLADLFSQVIESGEYFEQGAASLVEYARRRGHHGARAIVLARLGQAIRVCPDLAERLRSGSIHIESAETIAAVVANPATRELEDWLDLAENCELKALRNVVHLRREEAKRQGEKLKAVPLLLTDDEIRKVRRVREIASQRLHRQLTESQGVVVAMDDFLERRDPERKARQSEASPSQDAASNECTEAVPDSEPARRRYIPKEVEHAVRERAGHHCEVPGCTATTGLELCHIRAWSRGGEHSPRNLVLLCHRHHVMLDAEHISCLGFTAGCRPIFRLPDGEILLPKPTGPPP